MVWLPAGAGTVVQSCGHEHAEERSFFCTQRIGAFAGKSTYVQHVSAEQSGANASAATVAMVVVKESVRVLRAIRTS
jgi:hypothetical protein